MINEHRVTNEVIHYSKLFVDFTYQRGISKSKIKKMIEAFEPAALTMLIVSERENGSFAIIDGQHRFEAGKLMNVENFSCQVHIGLSIAEEARLFHDINVNRGPMRSSLQFKALLEAQDLTALQIKLIVESFGFQLEYTTGTKCDNKFVCTSELQKVYKIGPEHLNLVLSVLKKTWNGKKESLRYQMVGAISKFLKLYKNQIDIERLIKVLKSISIEDIYRKARTRTEVDGSQMPDSLEREIFKLYNLKLRHKI